MTSFAIITGAAGGLGKAFSFELAKIGYNTILIDLPNKELASISNEIENKYSNKSLYYETDLTNIGNIIEMSDDINQKYNVSILVNNAGVGGTKRFEDADFNYLNTIIQLNVMATTIMTKQIFPNLQKQEKSYILNVSSMVAFSPVAFKTVYPASKVFVHFFSRGLYEEFKKSNVFVSVVNPGPMKTNSDVTARINRQGFLGRLGLMSPEKVAEISVKQLFKRDTLIMLRTNGLSWLLLKFIPIWIRLPLFSKAVRREIIN
ncbi:SDR family NAD(P)-dependent oxidoreductase [Algoriphagus sp. AGSA1]|uniref:SDR family NAD(P)-dependent oxidoreductase n=1 Tax=Algoriphagus sp. AGSA1 TaxID=2907213 RepID=UPI001F2341C7|nr:SDR family NAD(P)-dependent oxidoreductase [Algoriphagus sp. AGSA1]MCE7056429.1 SDR family NAD(P)-dependent oxidoreductase [Algoriphagus sp. AGSA1]